VWNFCSRCNELSNESPSVKAKRLGRQRKTMISYTVLIYVLRSYISFPLPYFAIYVQNLRVLAFSVDIYLEKVAVDFFH